VRHTTDTVPTSMSLSESKHVEEQVTVTKSMALTYSHSPPNSLRLTRCGDRGAALIAQQLDKSLPQLHTLDLAKNTIGAAGAKALMAAACQQKQLRVLVLDSNRIGSDGAEAVASLVAQGVLKTLSLVACGIDARGAHALAAASGRSVLSSLDLSENQLGPDGAAALGAALPTATHLTTLLLTRNEILAAGAEALAPGLAKSHLTRLSLSDNGIKSGGVCAVLDALARAPLQVLDISRNTLQPSGCRIIAERLPECVRLRELDLSENACDDEAIDELAPSIAHAKFSVLKFAGGGGDFAHNQSGEIRSHGAQVLFGTILATPGRGLSTVLLPSQGIRDDAVAAICAWINSGMAERLSLEANKLTAAGGAALIHAAATCSRLFSLDLSRNSLSRLAITDLPAIADRSHGLHTLGLACTTVTADTVTALAARLDRCASLREVDLRGNPGTAAVANQWPARIRLKF
jgi:Ran GTPase-activating protein (RanGAP) involved in mRNA processing and transport